MKCLYLAWKDLKGEFRTKQMLNSMLLLALLIILIFSFAFQYLGNVKQYTSGVLWTTIIFASILGLSRSFALEKEQSCLEGLKLCPVERSTIYYGKTLSNFSLVLIMELIIIPLMIIFNFNLPIIELIPFILLGTVGLVAAGTLLSALAMNTKLREMLLPVILLPILLPLLVTAVTASTKLINGDLNVTHELRLLIIYDIIFLIFSHFSFEYIIED
jgi:heme exporter protein B